MSVEASSRTARRSVLRQLWFWVLVAIVAGIIFGLTAPGLARETRWLAQAFIQLIKAVTGPVIFVTVVVGIASLGNLARAGGLALRALAYFLAATVVALFLGLLAANVVGPGEGFTGTPDPEAQAELQAQVQNGPQESGVVPFLLTEVLPSSLAGPLVENKILQILVLAILTAAAISTLAPQLRQRVVGGFEAANKVLFGLIGLIMWVAPLAAFGGIAYTVAVFGASALGDLGKLMLTFWATCIVFLVVVLGAVSACSGFNIFKLIRLIKDELLIIIGTSSSETVLPKLLAKLESAGASRQTVGMVIPTGYSFNLDGTCLYLTLAALFIVQAAGGDMPLGAQLALVALMLLTSKGAAGISGAGLVTLVASLQAFGGEFFSPEAVAIGAALVVGIDRVMSEGRALTNAIGNCVATMVIAGWQGERDDERFAAVLNDPKLADADVERATRATDEETAAPTDPQRDDARLPTPAR